MENQQQQLQSWRERLPEILEGYSERDVLNMDETGCFWKALPQRGFAQKGKMCKGGKKSKLRVNALGEKELKPIVIWKSETPRCLKGVDKSQLPVLYYHQPKAWMTSTIMHSVLTKLKRSRGRFVLLLIDGAGCHPSDL